MIPTRIAVLLAVVFVASGCSAASTVTTPIEEPAATAAARSADRPTEAELAAFIKAFTRKYPDLSRGRSKVSIGDDADNTCLDLRQDTERAIIIKHVQARFARDAEPSVKTAAGILALIRAKACPDD